MLPQAKEKSASISQKPKTPRKYVLISVDKTSI
jgi:hypothetical protein